MVLYEFDETKIISLSQKKRNDKLNDYRETYEILLKKYYEEKELTRTTDHVERNKQKKKKLPIKLVKESLAAELAEKTKKRILIQSTDNQERVTNQDTSYEELNVLQENIIPNRGNLEPEKRLRTFTATNRNLTIVKYLKDLYQNKCQICGETIEVSPGNFLSEVHHIRSLGEHDGADVIENMIVLCPNHHAMFDRGSITLDLDKKTVVHFNPDNTLNNKQIELKHDINRNYIDFHNMNIFVHSNQIARDKNNITVDYGNTVTLQDAMSSEIFDITLEDKHHSEFMKPLEIKLLGKSIEDIVGHNGFTYKIIKNTSKQ